MWDLPGPGIEPVSPGVGRWIPDQWATRMSLPRYPTLPLDCSSWEQISLPDVAFIFSPPYKEYFWACIRSDGHYGGSVDFSARDVIWDGKKPEWLNPLSRPWNGTQGSVLCHPNASLLLKAGMLPRQGPEERCSSFCVIFFRTCKSLAHVLPQLYTVIKKKKN